MLVLLLKLNGIQVKYSQEELIGLGLKVAEGEMTEEDIYKWIIDHKK